MAFNSTGNLAGSRQGGVEVVHTFPINYNTVADNTPVLVGVIKASATNPVNVEVTAQVVTAFNATTTNVLTVGTTTSANEWLVAADIGELTAGFYPASLGPKNLSFTGAAAAGACTLTGAVKGDRVLGVTGLIGGIGGTIVANNGSAAASFETTITVADQIQQSSASDLSAKTYMAQLVSGGTANRFRLTSDTNVYINYDYSGTAPSAGVAKIIIREFSENVAPIA